MNINVSQWQLPSILSSPLSSCSATPKTSRLDNRLPTLSVARWTHGLSLWCSAFLSAPCAFSFGERFSKRCISRPAHLRYFRAVYRTIELSDGWTGRIIRTEVYFSKPSIFADKDRLSILSLCRCSGRCHGDSRHFRAQLLPSRLPSFACPTATQKRRRESGCP